MVDFFRNKCDFIVYDRDFVLKLFYLVVARFDFAVYCGNLRFKGRDLIFNCADLIFKRIEVFLLSVLLVLERRKLILVF